MLSPFEKVINLYQKYWIEIALIWIIAFFGGFIFFTFSNPPLDSSNFFVQPRVATRAVQAELPEIGPYPPENLVVEVNPNRQVEIPFLLSELPGETPDFFTATETGTLISPNKYDSGNYEYRIGKLGLSIQVKPKDINPSELKTAIIKTLSGRQGNYGIYVYDLVRDIEVTINITKSFPPASLSKLPSVALVLRDIDSGKYTFDTPITVLDKNKHVDWDNIGKYPEGTQLPLHTFIDEAIITSNNTAHYHLHNEILGNAGPVLSRTKAELGVGNFSLNPHKASAKSVAKFFTQLYNHEFLSDENSDYLIELLKNAAPALKDGIPAGIPSGTSIEVANKAGFLFGGIEGNTYSDAGIIYGETTDYVLVILNNSAPPFPNGKFMIQDISRVVYTYLDS